MDMTWMQRGRCREIPPSTFFPSDGVGVETARRICADCPVQRHCSWRAAGYPVSEVAPRRSQSYAGTDRQCRGALLAVLRD